jgi:hypothetical protein
VIEEGVEGWGSDEKSIRLGSVECSGFTEERDEEGANNLVGLLPAVNVGKITVPAGIVGGIEGRGAKSDVEVEG